MSKRYAMCFATCLIAVFAFLQPAAGSTVSPSLYGGMRWRLVGPFRGGWGTCATGVPGRPDVYYFGAAGGGVWKTTDSGRTWQSVFSTVHTSAIGAIAVAPSNPDIVYAGTGQVTARYDVAAGDGVYKSTDGGRTWHYIGLANTRHIGRIIVDQHNPDIVLVAALGHIFGPGPARGIYRTTNGGRTWKKVLYINSTTGVVDLAVDSQNPKVIFAAAWQVQNYPWLSYFRPTIGKSSGVYKSTDGGISWSRIVAGYGWPQGALGRIGLAATHTSHGTRVYALVDASHDGGLYRSDDSGQHWQYINHDATLASDYFGRVTVSPADPDMVYTMGRSIHRSIDGGRNFTIVKGAPGGDDYHYLWINPADPRRMITASDQGTVISINGGRTWSSWYNQPTGQFYHLAADNRFPYWIYSGQQDSGTVGISSRSDFGAISFRDWHPVGGDERDYDVPDPRDPNIVYGSGLGGHVSRFDAHTGQVQNISPWPVDSYAALPTTVKYRYTWITPLVVSHKPPYALYLGAQVLFRSTDQGDHWTKISPDLSGARTGTAGCGREAEGKKARNCGFGVIYSISLSPINEEEIWAGTDDGLIHLTRDGGRHWHNVTPAGLPIWSRIDSLDASALDVGTVYAAVDSHRRDDFSPHIYRTHDYGRTWTEITTGLPKTHFVSVVRADPKRRGLLYAGTDEGVYVSFDDGDHWQSLQQNFPFAWVRDLLVHGDDLIAATQGRAIWVLDNVTPLRQASAALSRSSVHLFKPADAIRIRRDENRDTPPPPETPLGKNPPTGAILDYYLGRDVKGPVTLEIRDSHGHLVRRFSSEEKFRLRNATRYFTRDWLRPAEMLSAKSGGHRFVWNLHYAQPKAIRYGYTIAAVYGENTPTVPEGPLALPGKYQVTLRASGMVRTVPLTVRMDPRVYASRTALEHALQLSRDAGAALARAYRAYGEISAVEHQLQVLGKKAGSVQDGKTLLSGIARLKERLGSFTKEPSSGKIRTFPAISTVLAGIETEVEGADRAPTAAQEAVYAQYNGYLQANLQSWKEIVSSEIKAFNIDLRKAGLSPLVLPKASEIRVTAPAESNDLP